MSDHTPEPWYVGPHSTHGDCYYEVYDAVGDSIAHVSGRPGAEAEHNAKLMHAAPELLSALSALVEHTAWICDGSYSDDVDAAYAAARAVIAKAGGAQ